MASKEPLKGPYNIELQRAVKYLRGKKIFSKDKELAERMGNSAGTISNYTNGKSPASPQFLESFETTFKIKLSDFSEDNIKGGDADLAELVAGHEERLLRIEAHLEVFKSTIAGLMTKDGQEFAEKFELLQGLVEKAVGRRFDEAQRK